MVITVFLVTKRDALTLLQSIYALPPSGRSWKASASLRISLLNVRSSIFFEDETDKDLDGMEKVICVSTAKVPIVKIWDPELRLACDMNVNNTLALENTRMIKTYIGIDPRVRQLAMIIKHWTKQRILNDAGTFVSPLEHSGSHTI